MAEQALAYVTVTSGNLFQHPFWQQHCGIFNGKSLASVQPIVMFVLLAAIKVSVSFTLFPARPGSVNMSLGVWMELCSASVPSILHFSSKSHFTSTQKGPTRDPTLTQVQVSVGPVERELDVPDLNATLQFGRRTLHREDHSPAVWCGRYIRSCLLSLTPPSTWV